MKRWMSIVTALAVMLLLGWAVNPASAMVAVPTSTVSTVAAPAQPPQVKLKGKAKLKFKKAVKCGGRAARHEQRTAPPADPSVKCLSELKGKKFWAEAFQKCTPPAEGYAKASARVSQYVVAISVAKSMAPNSRVTARNKIVDMVFAKTEVELVCSNPPPVMITVCELSSKQIVTIDQTAFDPARYSTNLAACEPGTIVSVTNPNDVVWCNARTIEVRGRVPDGQVGVLQIAAQIGTVSFNPLSCGANDQVAMKKQNVTGEFAVKFWYLAPTEGTSDTVKVYLFSKGGVKEDEASVSFGLTKPPVDPKKANRNQ